MNLFKKNLSFILSAAGITFLYFLTRIYNILSLPIFTDEAIYTRWSQIAKYDSAWRFISLTDGKQPLLIWLNIVSFDFFKDPLLAGRMVSVFSGFLVMAGLFAVSYLLFRNKTISLLSSFLYVIFPFALIYDKMAIYESLLAVFFIWGLFFEILLVKKMRMDIAMVLGFILGGGVLTKSSGFLSIYLMPFLFILLDVTKKTWRRKYIKLILLLLVSIVIANGMYGVLRLSPFFHIIAEKNLVFVQTPVEWLKLQNADKISTFLNNFTRLGGWFVNYFSIPFIATVILAFIFKRNYKEKIILLLWFVLPFFALVVAGKVIYPRFIFFMTIPLLPLVAYGFYMSARAIKNKIAILFLSIALVSYPLFASYYVLFDIARAPIPELDLEQLINGWPAGGGVRKSIVFFEKEAEKKPIMIVTQGTFGLMPFAYEIYLIENKNIEIKGYWPTKDNIPDEVLKISEKKDTYFVFYQPCTLCEYPGAAPKAWPLEKVSEFKKGIGETTLSVYKVVKR